MPERFDWSWVKSRAAETASLWNVSAGPAPVGGPRYTASDQRLREHAYDKAMRDVEQEARKQPQTEAEQTAAQDRMTECFAAKALDLEDDAIHLLTGDFLPAGTTLAQWAREFDPELAREDIVQACRNAWTACGLQPLLGEPVRLTPSILGYSLLYPYTDNFLDDPRIASAAKQQFDERFRARLSGDPATPNDRHEDILWDLVGLIEGQYPRTLHPQVYDGLLAIHRAQQQSLAQVRSIEAGESAQLLSISCAKGGSSVLVDACLARGWLTPQESRFAFNWGVLLQLGDDLQDVGEDLGHRSATLFSQAASLRIPLDQLASQLLRFSDCVSAQMEALPLGSPMLKRLLRSSWRSLIVQAVADSREHFTSDYLREIERSSPFRFEFLRSRRKRMTRRRGLYETLFDRFLQMPQHGFADLPAPPARSAELSCA